MLIDWFTVGAQAVNFLALLYLLKRFLYGPILRAMDRREAAIKQRLEEAEKTHLAAEQAGEEYRQKLQQLEQQVAARLKQADEAAERRRRELLEQAKSETAELRQSWSEAIARERELFLGELKKRAGAEVLRIARKATTELTGEGLQPRLAAVLLTRLRGLEKAEREKCVAAAKSVAPEVRAPFALGAELERKITAALHQVCASEAPVAFTSDADMPLGIETTIGELRLSWGVESYFSELEKSVSELLTKSLRPATEAEKGGPEDD